MYVAAYLPEVEMSLWLPRPDQTEHVPSDRWFVTCNTTVNGVSVLRADLYYGWCATALPAEAGPPGFMVTAFPS